VKEQPECECGLNGQIGVDRLGAALASLRRCPGVDGVLTDPPGEVAAITERLVILAPVFGAVGGFGFRMSVGSFVRFSHDAHRWMFWFVMTKA
jgi:hypothetical protein